MNRIREEKVLIFFFLMLFTISSFFINQFYYSSSSQSKNTEILTPQTPHKIQINTNLTPSGPGKLLNCFEWSWGTKTETNLNENSELLWDIPGDWLGNQLSLNIWDLKEILSKSQINTAIEHNLISGEKENGTYWVNTKNYGNYWYNVSYTRNEHLDLTLRFHEEKNLDISSVSEIKIAIYGYESTEDVDILIHNFDSDEEIDTNHNMPPSLQWKNISITSNIDDYISSYGMIWIQFYHFPLLIDRSIHLDYVAVEITATWCWVNPQDSNVNLRLYDNQTEYNIINDLLHNGSGVLTIPNKEWKDSPMNFSFRAENDIDLIFNISYTLWISQDKTFSVLTEYYLNQSVSNPDKHMWKLSFHQDHLPIGGYTNLNFTISPVPLDWNIENVTDPGGGSPTLNRENNEIQGDNLSKYDDGGDWIIWFNSPNYIIDLQFIPDKKNILIVDELRIGVNLAEIVTNGEVNLTISFENDQIFNNNQNAFPLQDFNWNISETTKRNGTYVITTTFFNNTEIGIYSHLIKVIYPTNFSIIAPDTQFVEFLKGEIINLTVFFENLFYPGNYYNERGTNGSKVKWELSNSSYEESGYLTDKFEGIYNALINTSLLKVVDGDYYLTVIANKSTYQNHSLSFEMRCFEKIHITNASIITQMENIVWITGMNYTTWVYPNQSITLQLNYTDIYQFSKLVDYAKITAYLYSLGGQVLLNYPINGIRFKFGHYKINISNLGLQIGQYMLLINMSKEYYANSSIWIEYTIKELDTTIIVSKLYEYDNITDAYEEWEDLDISFKVEYTTTKYLEFDYWDTPVDWGSVRYFIVPFNGDPLDPNDVIKSGIIIINATGIFEIHNLTLSNATGKYTPGVYQVYIKANATNCEEKWFNFNLTILKRLNTTLTINRFPSSFRVDRAISIEATLDSDELEDKSHFNGKIIYFNITVFYKSLDPSTFLLQEKVDQFGEVEMIFQLSDHVPVHLDDVNRLEIVLFFEGYESYYPIKSFYNCSSGDPIIMDVIVPFNFMLIIYIIIGIVTGAIILGFIYQTVIIPKGIEKNKNINYLFASFRDVVGIKNLFVLLKTTGDCILTKTFSPERIEYSMENMLIKAIANYGKGDQSHDAFCDLIRFEDFTLLLDDGEYIRAAITISSHPSSKLIRSLVRFVQFFELQNYSVLMNANGPVKGLYGVDELLDIQFGASLIAPYTLSTGKIKKASGFQETLILMSMNLMKDYDYFYLSQLYANAKNETLIDEMMIFKTIQDLINKKIIIPFMLTKKRKKLSKNLEIP